MCHEVLFIGGGHPIERFSERKEVGGFMLGLSYVGHSAWDLKDREKRYLPRQLIRLQSINRLIGSSYER